MSVVLIVDDEHALLEVLGDFVASLGHDVTLASDGREALEKARERTPDLVISDVMMPRMNGLALSSAFESEPALCRVPMILMSAVTLERVPDGRGFVRKPFDLDQFEVVIAAAIDQSRRGTWDPPDGTRNKVEPARWIAVVREPLEAALGSLVELEARLEELGDEKAIVSARAVSTALAKLDAVVRPVSK